MNRRDFITSAAASIAAASVGQGLRGQSAPFTPDLARLADANSLTLFNRRAAGLVDGVRTGVRLNAAPGEGVVFVPGTEFSNGTIAIDLRGKAVAQQSFVGVAFHGVDGTAHDAVYFRPFNFRAADQVARSHSVQYHSMPEGSRRPPGRQQLGRRFRQPHHHAGCVDAPRTAVAASTWSADSSTSPGLSPFG